MGCTRPSANAVRASSTARGSSFAAAAASTWASVAASWCASRLLDIAKPFDPRHEQGQNRIELVAIVPPVTDTLRTNTAADLQRTGRRDMPFACRVRKIAHRIFEGKS